MHFAQILTGRAPIMLALPLLLLSASPVHADSITLQWNASSGTVAGYAVYMGSSRVDVGNTTTYTFPTAVAGQNYCFAVAAYNSVGEGPMSGQVCGYSNQFPSLTNPGSQSSTAGQSASLQLSGSDPDGQAVTYSATGLPPGLFIGTATGFVSGIPTTAGTYPVTAQVHDGVLQSAAQTFNWTVASAPTADTNSPSVSIAAPTSSASYTTSNAVLSLTGSASDNVGVASVTWVNDRGGSGTASGTTSWGIASVGLQAGTNVITVTARDAAGNAGTDVLTVTHSLPDTTAPAVTINSPTTSPTYATESAAVTISGSASDAVGTTRVSWVNDRGGSGTASGTTSWSIPLVQLAGGANIITVTAQDAAGNRGTDVLTVNYAVPDTIVPTVTITGPTNTSTFATTSSSLPVAGSASDNVGVTQVAWSNDRGGSGMATGTGSWSVSAMTLQLGTNIITVTARDAAGNQATDVLTVTYSTAQAPAPAPTPAITLSGRLYASGKWVKAFLQWSNVSGKYIDVYRDGERITRTSNDGSTSDSPRGYGIYTYRVCVTGTNTCSNTLTLSQ